MAELWSQRLTFRFAPEAPLPSRARALVGPKQDTGPNTVLGHDLSAQGSILRIASEPRFPFPATSASQALYRAWIGPPANAHYITPIDIPCVVPIDTPVNVYVEPIRAPELGQDPIEEVVIVTAWEGVGAPYSFGGTLWLPVETETPTLIPDWTGAMTCLDTTDPVITWLDADLATPVGTWTGTYRPRPRRAAAISHTEQATVNFLCHWTQ